MGAEIKNPGQMRLFIEGGNATFTLVSVDTQKRFTFKVRTPKDVNPNKPILFVSVLDGPDNWSNYKYMGTIRKNRYLHGKKSKIAISAPCARAFAWFYARLVKGEGELTTMEFWHEGKCARCARKLTVPESIACGFGEICAGKLGIPWAKPTPTQIPLPETNTWKEAADKLNIPWAKPGTDNGFMTDEEVDAWKEQMKEAM